MDLGSLLFFGAPAMIGLGAASWTRGQRTWARRFGAAALGALVLVYAWHGIWLGAAAGGADTLIGALWATVLSSPAWGGAAALGAWLLRPEP